MKKLGVSPLDERNRIYVPQAVIDVLPKGDRLSWELDEETNCVCVFMGHERFLRKNQNKCQIKGEGNERNGSHS